MVYYLRWKKSNLPAFPLTETGWGTGRVCRYVCDILEFYCDRSRSVPASTFWGDFSVKAASYAYDQRYSGAFKEFHY